MPAAAAFVAGALLIGLSAGYAVAPGGEEEVAALEEQLGEAEGEADRWRSYAASFVEERISLENRIDELEDQIVKLESAPEPERSGGGGGGGNGGGGNAGGNGGGGNGTGGGSPGARSFGDGTYRVPNDIDPGTYRASGGNACYWERLRNFGGDLNSIITNGFADKSPIVTIEASDAGFSSQSCGTWERV